MINKSVLAIIVTLVIFEYIWLGCIQKNNWKDQIFHIQGSYPSYRLISTILAYLVMIISIYYLSVPNVRRDFLVKDSIKWGALLGLAMYGIFNFTNYAMFKQYSLATVITDLVWGIFITILATLIGSYFYSVQ